MTNTGMCNGVKIKQIDLARRGKRRIVKRFSTRLIITPLSLVFTRFSDSKVSKMRVIYRCDSHRRLISQVYEFNDPRSESRV